ncbi:MAG: DUF378 domain-containing protein [Pirellulaceae bacterium]|nr:DUF378 domain-containing protein [Pirellulaceae bacterium]
MRSFHPLAYVGIIVLIVGGLNWGLVGLFSFDLVGYLFGEMSLVSRTIYILVGCAAVGIGTWVSAHACGCDFSQLKNTSSTR